MILRGSWKVEAFVSAIACTIGRDARARHFADTLTFEALANKDAIYLASGHWRAIPIWDDTDLVGVRLVNPDRTPEEIARVEQGIAILCHCDYRS